MSAELLEQARELERASRDGRRYQYDREEAARELVELVPQLLAALSRVEQERDEALRALNGMLEMHCCDCTFCEDAAAAVGREDA
jgi:hypothetical protein